MAVESALQQLMFANVQVLAVFSTGYGQRPQLLDIEGALAHPDHTSGPRQYLENQR
jgi:hypothetical protein